MTRKGSFAPPTPRRIHIGDFAGRRGEGRQYLFTIPPIIGRLIPKDQWFMPELVEEGILLRRVDGPEAVDGRIPSWAKQPQEKKQKEK